MGEKDCFLDFVITGFFVLKVIQNERLNKFKQKYCFCDSIQNSTSLIYISPHPITLQDSLIDNSSRMDHWMSLIFSTGRVNKERNSHTFKL